MVFLLCSVCVQVFSLHSSPMPLLVASSPVLSASSPFQVTPPVFPMVTDQLRLLLSAPPSLAQRAASAPGLTPLAPSAR